MDSDDVPQINIVKYRKSKPSKIFKKKLPHFQNTEKKAFNIEINLCSRKKSH